ncbi:glycoside hydrolase family 31 protein [Bacillus sp. PS06]|uniref:glycoside hydrolase family 31 protein n=1 Tax=Bacillus sp. PS06 TaxID=2764176 RepID=UPI00177AAA00|nr:glycoside hydrolase family 31 protein [Bacillus sp. PS06]MBD8069541.1 glycoside hydrolase family 31 protein [Bacillus sp. PS06]
MQDTSFAIHPGNKKSIDGVPYHDIGDLKHFTQINNTYSFVCEQGYVNIVFYRDEIARIVMNPFSAPTMESSFALVTEPEEIDVVVIESEQAVTLNSSKLSIKISRSPFRLAVYDENNRLLVEETARGMGYNEKKEVICYKDMKKDDHFYGFGEKTSFLDKRGEKMTMWNSDVYAPHNPEIDALYESIPFFITVRGGKAHGIFFDNTFKSVFDMKTETDVYSFSAEGGELDYYVMAGPTPKDVLTQYTTLTGRMQIPPKWALGYHQSRYSYETEAEVRELVQHFLDKEIPVDAIYLDIHYMDGYRVFTFDRDRFPNPEKLMKDLKEAGIHVVPIVDPGVKEDPEYPIYQEGINEDRFCKYIDGKIYHGDVWPGNSAFPDFMNSEVREWWGQKHKFYTDLGIEGIWNDMNEPAVFNETKTMDVKVMHNQDGTLKTHREMHNVYGFYMGEATYNGMKNLLNGNRPFLLTRAGYAGIQRYGAVWTGDNRSFWEHLQMAIPMCMNLGISGVPLTGPDVGGFAHDTTGELLARWTQFGTFTPYFRNHSAINTVRQEPWSFGEEIESTVKKYIQLRYVWLPHLYTLFNEASKTGVPVMRPLLMEYPDDQHTVNLSDQFLIGSNVIVAPITAPSTFHRVVYLPEGNWINYWTSERIAGSQHILVEADINTLPIFVKEGSILAHGSVKQSTEKAEENLQIHVYPSSSGQASYVLYEDDGKTFSYEQGEYLEKSIRCEFNEDRLEFEVKNQGNYQPEWKEWTLVIHDVEKDKQIFINGELATSEYLVDTEERTLIIKLDL